ncbi:MAG: right-handed parallel beta-helix repeat-containing protein [Candidatus Hermodarchaeota archaeon]
MRLSKTYLIVFILIGVNSWVIIQYSQYSTKNHFLVNPVASQPLFYYKTANPIQKNEKIAESYIEHEPIAIDGNADFIAQANAESWPGDGSESNPIIINGLVINDSGSPGASISIYNTDLHFRINSSFLSGEEHGISFSSVTNGIISNNIITNISGNGIVIGGSSNNRITKNNISNGFIGIEVSSESHHNSYTNNHIINMSFGGVIIQDACFSNLIDSNVLRESDLFGILIGEFGDVHSNIISNNEISNVETAIEIIQGSYFNKIQGNFIHDNTGGININGVSDNNSISSNIIYNNNGSGIGISDSNKTMLYNNTLYRNLNPAIFLTRSKNNEFYENRIMNNTGALALYSSTENSFINNTIHDHANIGIFLDLSHNNTFLANFISENRDAGIYLLRSNYNSFSENIFWKNLYEGINCETNSSNNVISFNDFTDNYIPAQQAADSGSNNLFVYNFWNNWITPDTDSDGFVDIPYPIDANQDPYPLVNLDLELKHIVLTPMLIYPNGGEVLNGTIYINWTSSVDSHKHEINYTLYYSADNGQEWVILESDLKTTSYQWDTTTVSNGKHYSIKIVASCSEGLNTTDLSNAVFTIENISGWGFPNDFIQILVGFVALIGAVGIGYFLLNSRMRHTKSFVEFIQSERIDFLRSLYHKVIVGLENVAVGMITEQVETPLLEPTEPMSLAEYFPSDIRENLKSGMKARTVLTLIEIAFQYADETHPMYLSRILDIPPSTLSAELQKLTELNYIEFHVSPKTLQDGRFRNYTITPKGVSFLHILKGALELSIRRMKEKSQSDEILYS